MPARRRASASSTANRRTPRRWPALRRPRTSSATIAAMLDARSPTLVDVVLPPVAQERGSCARRRARHPDHLPEALRHRPDAGRGDDRAGRTPPACRWWCTRTSASRPGSAKRAAASMPASSAALHGIAFRLRPGDGQGPQAYLDRQPYFQQMPRVPGARDRGALHRHLPLPDGRGACGDRAAAPAEPGRSPARMPASAVRVRRRRAPGLFDGNRLNDHVATNPRRTMGEMWLEGERGVMRLDGEARLWWKPHHGAETRARLRPRAAAAPSAARCTALQRHVLAHLRRARRWRTARATTWPTCACRRRLVPCHRRIALPAAAAVAPMAGFDPPIPVKDPTARRKTMNA